MTDPRDIARYRGVADATWDAGAMGCGELIVRLRFQLQAMAPGAVLHLIATDEGVRADLPAWCRMTRHTLVASTHPDYWIRKRED